MYIHGRQSKFLEKMKYKTTTITDMKIFFLCREMSSAELDRRFQNRGNTMPGTHNFELKTTNTLRFASGSLGKRLICFKNERVFISGFVVVSFHEIRKALERKNIFSHVPYHLFHFLEYEKFRLPGIENFASND